MPKEEKKEEMRESCSGRSMIDMFVGCPRSWCWKYYKGFKDAKTAEHFILGSAVHEAHQAFYENNFSMKAMMERAEEFLNDTEPLLLPKALVMLDIWFQMIGVNDISMTEVLAVEEEVYLTLPNGFKMTCRLDRLLRDKRSGEVFICDTKTTSWSLEGTLRNYTYHVQPQLYFMAARETLPDLMKDCRGWKTDGIYAKEKVLGGEKTGSWYSNAVRSETVIFMEPMLQDTLNSYAAITDDIAYRIQQADEGVPLSICFPKSNEHCLAFNRPCPYYNFCHKIDTIDGIPANFELDPWLKSGEVLNRFRDLEV